MERYRFSDLVTWLQSADRLPLVIRGARQVGKTWLVRQLAKSSNLQLIEFNFEERPQDISLFRTNDPSVTLREIGSSRGIDIAPQNTLLFLDEIQNVAELFPKLRWFAERMPELAVIATGSLLDFTLEKHSFSMPVGRIEYLYLEPLSFEEFLIARGKHKLVDYLNVFQIKNSIPETIHIQLMDLYKEFIIVGGLPAAVSTWINEQSLTKVNKTHHNLLSTYRDDFGKYRGRISKDRLENILFSVPKQLSNKFVYSHANPDVHSSLLNQALDLLTKARICHKIISTHANGIPLEAETQEKFFKVILLDVGLCSAQLGLTLDKIHSTNEINLINSGGIAEQSTGQLLRTLPASYIDPSLYCWMRQESGSNAEIDYVIQHKNHLVPIEVKAGKSGTLKSLHYFMGKKHFEIAVRVNSDYPSFTKIDIKDTVGNPVNYELLSIPFYLLGQIHRLLDENNNSV